MLVRASQWHTGSGVLCAPGRTSGEKKFKNHVELCARDGLLSLFRASVGASLPVLVPDTPALTPSPGEAISADGGLQHVGGGAARRVIAHRAMLEIEAGARVLNLGVGMPEVCLVVAALHVGPLPAAFTIQ